MRVARHDDAMTEIIIREAITIHRDLGPGLLESAYETFLAFALQVCGLRVERQVPVPIRYRGQTVEVGYRIDLLVERSVVVEIKSIDKLAPNHTQQALTHIRLGGYPTGLLLNFGAGLLRDGLKRLVNDHPYEGNSPVLVSGEPPFRSQ